MRLPSVSVVIDTYNHERFIEQAVVSAIEQDIPPSEVEIIVVDDGSTDRTREIIRKFEPRIRLISKSNGGQASAFNVAVPETRAPVVAFLDGDDWWDTTKLQQTLNAFARNSDIAAVGHGYYEVWGELPPTEMLVPERTCRLDLSSVEAARVADFGRTLLGTSRLAVRRRILEHLGPIPSNLIFCADTPILTLSLALGGAVVLDQPLCYYRLHAENLHSLHSSDPYKLHRKSEVMAFLLEYLPQRLVELSVPTEVIAALFDADQIELERLQSLLGRRGRLQRFKIEMHDFRKSYRKASLAYASFKCLTGVMALLFSPKYFYRLRNWYAHRNLKRFRGWFAEAEPVVAPTLFQRRSVIKPNN